MNGDLLTHDDVIAELKTLAAVAEPTIKARPDLAQVVLDRSKATVRRRRTRQAGIVVGGGLLVLATAAATRPGSGTHFAVLEPSESMAPTVLVGDQVIFHKSLVPQRGDVVHFTIRIDGADFGMTKRVMALAGDEIACPAREDGRCEALVVNGRPVAEPYLGGLAMDPFAPMRVPAGSAFVLGDNRNVSSDSRVYGSVPLHDISGVGVRISRDGRSRPVPGAAHHPEPSGGVDPAGPPPPPAGSPAD
jgi:signal peptidase I